MADPNLFAQLEAMGLAAVKESLAKGKTGAIGSSHHNAVLGWVAIEEGKIVSASIAKRDAREEETLSIAKEANEIARSASFAASAAAASASEANTISRSTARRTWRAEIIAAIAAIAAIIAAIASVIGGK